MKIDILTLFPEMFAGPFDESMIKRAREKGIVDLTVHDLRDWAKDTHKTVDDRPYGGGPGMVMRVDIIDRAIRNLKSQVPNSKQILNSKFKTQKTILLTPQGQVFSQEKAKALSKLTHLILIAGHYEGVDERVREHLVDEEISIGDYVLTGGELPAMVVVDAVVRLIPGVVGDPESLSHESFSFSDDDGKPLLDYPHYTRPEAYKGWKVPDILLKGHHSEIDRWRNTQAKKRTRERRPDLRKHT